MLRTSPGTCQTSRPPEGIKSRRMTSKPPRRTLWSRAGCCTDASRSTRTPLARPGPRCSAREPVTRSFSRESRSGQTARPSWLHRQLPRSGASGGYGWTILKSRTSAGLWVTKTGCRTTSRAVPLEMLSRRGGQSRSGHRCRLPIATPFCPGALPSATHWVPETRSMRELTSTRSPSGRSS